MSPRMTGPKVTVTWAADSAIVPLWAATLSVYPDGDDRTKFWASIDLPLGLRIPVPGGPFPSRELAQWAAEANLRKRLDLIDSALQGIEVD